MINQWEDDWFDKHQLRYARKIHKEKDVKKWIWKEDPETIEDLMNSPWILK